MSGSGISWAICKSASRSRQITMSAPHHSVFYRPDALPAALPTASKHSRQVDVYTRHTQRYSQGGNSVEYQCTIFSCWHCMFFSAVWQLPLLTQDRRVIRSTESNTLQLSPKVDSFFSICEAGGIMFSVCPSSCACVYARVLEANAFFDRNDVNF